MISIVPRSKLSLQDERELADGLANYYSSSPQSYYDVAEQGGADYSSRILPFHADLVGRVRPGMRVLEVGCGSAHLCRYVEAAGGNYTGMDFGPDLLEQNRARYPNARFFPVGTDVGQTFDLVASLYTIEHVVNPAAYLDGMWRTCKPGGLLAVICPDFVDGSGIAPSVFFGTTPRRLRKKLRSMALLDALLHLSDLLWSAPRWKRRARGIEPGAFWINSKPRILHGASYTVDADAVHLPRLEDLVWWLEKKGATIITTSRIMPDLDPNILRHNCYVLAQTVAA